ncbi:MAG: phycobilisome linker polypeptide [Cyanobacteria bacterium P01_C01_bin.121]
MLGQYFASGVSESSRRIFVYEVAGLSENDMTALSQAPIRTSQNQFFQVPFSRMSREMQRILSLGGKIVNIQPLDAMNSPTAGD